MPAKPAEKKRRRGVFGLVVDRDMQFRAAIIGTSILVLPSAVLTITLMADIAQLTSDFASTGAPGFEVAQLVLSLSLKYGLIIMACFFFLSVLSIFFLVRLSNQLIGPVGRLENQIEGMLIDDFSPRGELRSGDYLLQMGELLNKLAKKLRDQQNSRTP